MLSGRPHSHADALCVELVGHPHGYPHGDLLVSCKVLIPLFVAILKRLETIDPYSCNLIMPLNPFFGTHPKLHLSSISRWLDFGL
jgi:hypothetical protein